MGFCCRTSLFCKIGLKFYLCLKFVLLTTNRLDLRLFLVFLNNKRAALSFKRANRSKVICELC